MTSSGIFAERITETPVPSLSVDESELMALMLGVARGVGASPQLAEILELATIETLLTGIESASPYLTSLVRQDPARCGRLLCCVPEAHLTELGRQLEDDCFAAVSIADAMRHLRRYKAEVALLCALADLAGVWSVLQVTAALSEAADRAIQNAVRFLFRRAADKGDIVVPEGGDRGEPAGYIVLGMGKYGARELNYSSDIDLIVFYDLERLQLREGIEPQPFFVRLTKDLVKMIQERTADGYVFRTDLRLRPDAGATQIALSTDAALGYYESFGQNWERAAMIKARVVAGDVVAGKRFLADLAPFIWRKYLDFAAILDIHAMKRQIHAFRGFGEIGVAGHNIKLGRGGIREIEFFAQTQQLIAGGRQPDLRVPDTLGALAALERRGWIEAAVRDDLAQCYLHLRRVEHRLQMVEDEQTQTLPSDLEKLASLARFSGFETVEAFSQNLLSHLRAVQQHYAVLFEDVPELTRGNANMVFAGEADDPGTLQALAKMGYSDPPTVISIVRGWHHGRYPAVRTARARELLTEVQPALIQALSETSQPDQAFARFDRFLSDLPSGVQLFALLRNNPSLLRLLADIMGSAPRLARILSRRRRVIDAVLDPGFFGQLPSIDELLAIIRSEIRDARDFQEKLDRTRIVGNEQMFLVGVRVLTGTIDAAHAGEVYAALADCLIAELQSAVEDELSSHHGRIPGGAAAVLAMGKLGGREMTAASDLDLILVYDFDDTALESDGERPLAPSQYFARLTQRLISALSAPTAQGTLYEVDMRLRPSGQKGPVATQLSSFESYHQGEAWTWEHMALTRARVLTGPPELRRKIEAMIGRVLTSEREEKRIAADVRDMRARIEKEKGTRDIWELKQVRGGLVDIEFIAQYLQLVHAARHPAILCQNTITSLTNAADVGILAREHADVLIPAARLIHNLTQVLRLCLDDPFEPEKAPEGLRLLLAKVGDAPSFAQLESHLRQTLSEVAALFDVIVT